MATKFTDVSEEHLKRFRRLIDQKGVRGIKRLYDRAQDELELKLSKLVGKSKTSFTAQQHRAALAQVRQGQIEIIRKLAKEMGASSEIIQQTAVKDLIKSITKLEKKLSGAAVALPIDEAARLGGIINKRRASMLLQHKKSMAGYGSKLIRKMQDELAVSMIIGETPHEAIDRIRKTADIEWWQAERIVRTEHAFAYNATQADAVKESSADIPDLMMRWVEHVDDGSGMPLDDRVGIDSIVMHGQVAPPGGKFTMPNDSRVHQSLWGKSWMFPPNRPNDRAVLQAWRPHWGVPGWVFRNGRRVRLRPSKK